MLKRDTGLEIEELKTATENRQTWRVIILGIPTYKSKNDGDGDGDGDGEDEDEDEDDDILLVEMAPYNLRQAA